MLHRWDVYRIGFGLVDYLGQLLAANKDEAETMARLRFDRSEGEEIEVQESER